MTPERWQQIDQLFHEALACEPAERDAFLSGACDGDEQLPLEVESLIDSHDQGQSFIEKPARTQHEQLLAHFSCTSPIWHFRAISEHSFM